MNDPVDNSDRASVVTFNRLGRTTTVLNEINIRFAELARHAAHPVLDIGCALGIAARAALETGATVIANDIESAHLNALAEHVDESGRGRLTLDSRRFPGEL